MSSKTGSRTYDLNEATVRKTLHHCALFMWLIDQKLFLFQNVEKSSRRFRSFGITSCRVVVTKREPWPFRAKSVKIKGRKRSIRRTGRKANIRPTMLASRDQCCKTFLPCLRTLHIILRLLIGIIKKRWPLPNSNSFFKRAQPHPLFVYFPSLPTFTNFPEKTVNFSGIRTWIVRVEGNYADH